MTRDQGKALLFFAGGILCLLLAGLLIVTFSGRWQAGAPTVVAGPLPLSVEKKDVRDLTDREDLEGVHSAVPGEEWVVYITGCVQKPGVYHVAPGSRFYHVVDLAGGFSSAADPEKVNLATRLEDGMHIHIPSQSEKTEEEQTPAASLGGLAPSNQKKIDINRASEQELTVLPGVGPSTAASIIAYREASGLFTCVEDLLRVRGIGPVKFEKIRPLVTVSP
ncbi:MULTISPECIES: helix-hairpin-helix domain-containing protein [Aminobacterium]|uniref:helix-hairpin-helix domain-containing protein n=1 Tax=Aminobacterium TaxID=81466 RepID=UPI00257D8FE3|nr:MULTISPECIES: helix-hairpin-helix domain-containing protein [unclassified Aminobacterium]